MIPIVRNVSYMTRGLSDYSPMKVILETGEGNYMREGRINPQWMELIEEPQEVLRAIREFVEINQGTASEGIVWDTLKAFFLGGIMIPQISKKSFREGERVANETTPNSLRIWAVAQQNYHLIIQKKIENRFFKGN